MNTGGQNTTAQVNTPTEAVAQAATPSVSAPVVSTENLSNPSGGHSSGNFKSEYSRTQNIVIGATEIVVGIATIVLSTKAAADIDVISGGTASYFAAKAALECWATGSLFIAYGITRLTNQNKSKITDEIISVFMPSEVDIAENLKKSANSRKGKNNE